MPTLLEEVPAELLTDFDIVADPGLHSDPQTRLLEQFAQDDRPIQYSPHNGGHWLITTHTLAHEILCDARRFGSFPIGVPANYTQRPRLIPLESDVGEHRRYRRLLIPVFAPDAIAKLETDVRTRTRALLDSALIDGELDFLRAIAKPIPTQLFASQMGLDEADLPKFYEWENGFYRAPTEEERAALVELRDALAVYDGPVEDEALQSVVYAVGREKFDPLRAWFTALYEVLLGASQGPRFGGFIALYGVAETIALIDSALAGELA